MNKAWALVMAHQVIAYYVLSVLIEQLPPPDKDSSRFYAYVYSVVQIFAANWRRTGDAVKRNVSVVAVILLVVFVLVACTPLERQAYNTVVAAKAFIDAERKIHPECSTGATSTLCNDLTRAASAKDALIDAAEVYCAGPQFEAGGACQPPAKGTSGSTQAITKLKAAIAAYSQAERDVKGAVR